MTGRAFHVYAVYLRPHLHLLKYVFPLHDFADGVDRYHDAVIELVYPGGEPGPDVDVVFRHSSRAFGIEVMPSDEDEARRRLSVPEDAI